MDVSLQKPHQRNFDVWKPLSLLNLLKPIKLKLRKTEHQKQMIQRVHYVLN